MAFGRAYLALCCQEWQRIGLDFMARLCKSQRYCKLRDLHKRAIWQVVQANALPVVGLVY